MTISFDERAGAYYPDNAAAHPCDPMQCSNPITRAAASTWREWLQAGARSFDDTRMRAWCSAVLVALLAVALSAAAADREPFAEGRLWRISKTGIGDSFVFGTIHVPDPRVSVIAKPVEDALKQSRLLAMELVPEGSDGDIVELEQLEGDRRLESLIGPAAFAQVERELAAQGVAPRIIERLKPWAALVRITRIAAPADAKNLDERLMATARAHGVRVTSLELVDEQIAAFDAIPLDSQLAILRHALKHREALAATIEPTIEAWLRGDLAALARIPDGFAAQFPDMAQHYREFARHVIAGRTVLMHYRVFMPLRDGRVFAAIGAAHLYGGQGLLAMLKRDGYRVTRIW
jgi:uncharacterized protein YbaP (TraB family)